MDILDLGLGPSVSGDLIGEVRPLDFDLLDTGVYNPSVTFDLLTFEENQTDPNLYGYDVGGTRTGLPQTEYRTKLDPAPNISYFEGILNAGANVLLAGQGRGYYNSQYSYNRQVQGWGQGQETHYQSYPNQTPVSMPVNASVTPQGPTSNFGSILGSAFGLLQAALPWIIIIAAVMLGLKLLKKLV